MKAMLSLGLAVVWLVGFAPAGAETLSVFWVKGFYKAEDDALARTIRAFEAKTGAKVELSRYLEQEMIPRTETALDSDTPPDLAFADVFDFQVTGKWAFDGKLEDLSDILLPLRDKFALNTLETTFLLNGKTNRRAYYAFPLKLQSMHINYWKDMLDKAGFKASDIPTRWDDYWAFWCERVQPALRRATGQRIFGIGAPMGVDSTDSAYSFLTFLDAFDVKLVDADGNLQVDDPKVREGLIRALTSYVMPALKGCAPSSVTSWRDPDNNAAFNARSVAMTDNPSLSIPGKWLDDSNNTALTPDQRAQARKNYGDLIVTTGFPNKPDGSKMSYRAAIKTGVVFARARNKALAKQFVSFLLLDENLTPYVEGALGRWFPVTKAGQARPFWQADPHRRSIHDQVNAGTVPFEFTRNYKFTVVNNENVWAVAMNRVVNEKVPAAIAVDEMIARIKAIVN
jgi:multiple sugar transport system substrate-binding protein